MGLNIINSSYVNVNNISGRNVRHAVAVGGGYSTYSQYINVTNITLIGGPDQYPTIDCHANVSDYSITGVIMNDALGSLNTRARGGSISNVRGTLHSTSTGCVVLTNYEFAPIQKTLISDIVLDSDIPMVFLRFGKEMNGIDQRVINAPEIISISNCHKEGNSQPFLYLDDFVAGNVIISDCTQNNAVVDADDISYDNAGAITNLIIDGVVQ